MLPIGAITRYTGWVLFLLIVIYIATGFSYAGYFGFSNFIDIQTAQMIHSNLYLALVLIVLVFLHCCLRILIKLGRGLRKGQGPVREPLKETVKEPVKEPVQEAPAQKPS